MEFPFLKTVITENETAELANIFAAEIKLGDVIILNGNLGSGKTFFIKKTLENFKITNANSPTFSIVNEYSGNYKFYHFDFYRINNVREIFDIGFNDYLNDRESVIFIEWGELYPVVLPQNRIEISINLEEDYSRVFRFTKLSGTVL